MKLPSRWELPELGTDLEMKIDRFLKVHFQVACLGVGNRQRLAGRHGSLGHMDQRQRQQSAGISRLSAQVIAAGKSSTWACTPPSTNLYPALYWSIFSPCCTVNSDRQLEGVAQSSHYSNCKRPHRPCVGGTMTDGLTAIPAYFAFSAAAARPGGPSGGWESERVVGPRFSSSIIAPPGQARWWRLQLESLGKRK